MCQVLYADLGSLLTKLLKTDKTAQQGSLETLFKTDLKVALRTYFTETLSKTEQN